MTATESPVETVETVRVRVTDLQWSPHREAGREYDAFPPDVHGHAVGGYYLLVVPPDAPRGWDIAIRDGIPDAIKAYAGDRRGYYAPNDSVEVLGESNSLLHVKVTGSDNVFHALKGGEDGPLTGGHTHEDHYAVLGDNAPSPHNFSARPYSGFAYRNVETDALLEAAGIPFTTEWRWVRDDAVTVVTDDTSTSTPASQPDATEDESEDTRKLREALDRIEALNGRVTTLTSAYRADLAVLGEAIKDTAHRSEWCGEYETYLNNVEGKLNDAETFLEHARRARDFDVSLTVSFDVTVTVSAEDADSASEQARSMVRGNPQHYVQEYGSHNETEVDDVNES